MLLHIGAFHLDVDSRGTTFWHNLAPRTRLLCAVLAVFAIALTPNGHWLTWAVYGVGVLILMGVARITLLVLLRRVAVEFLFISLVLLGTLFQAGGEVLWSWGWLRITTQGLTVLGSVSLKALLSLIMLNILVLTTSVPALLQALTVLRTPPLLVSILGAMIRYIEVLVNEFNAMRRAAVARNFSGGRSWQRLVLGNMIGSLFVRTYERGERVSQAMLARGYQGSPPISDPPRGDWRDILALSLTLLVVLLGQVLFFV